MRHRSSCGLLQGVAVEIELTRQEPQVIEVLHEAVERSQPAQHLRLLGHHHFGRVAAQHSTRVAAQAGVFDPSGSRRDYVSKPEIVLHADTRIAQVSPVSSDTSGRC